MFDAMMRGNCKAQYEGIFVLVISREYMRTLRAMENVTISGRS